MRTKVGLFLTLVLGGLTLTELTIPALGIFFLVLAGIIGADVMANLFGRKVRIRFPISFQHKNGQVIQETSTDVPGYSFYGSRYALARERPLKKILRETRTIWALWNTGTIAWAADAMKEGTVKVLVLPNPRSNLIKTLAQMSDKTEESLISEIEEITKEAQAVHVDIRWFDKFVGNTLMFGEPETENEWVQVETLIGYIPVDETPSFYVTVKDYKPLVNSLRKAFLRIKQESVVPSLR